MPGRAQMWHAYKLYKSITKYFVFPMSEKAAKIQSEGTITMAEDGNGLK